MSPIIEYTHKAFIEIHNMDYVELLSNLPDKSIDAIITDPPYEMDINMDEIRRVCKGNIIMFCAPLHPFFTPDDLQYWLKTPSTKNYSKSCGHFIEWITFEFHRGTFNPGNHWSNYTGFHDDKILAKLGHPYQKPESLLQRLISIYTNPGDTILDPFFGGGSTLRASVATGRIPIGGELDKIHYDNFERSLHA
jgi:DNA modification methylase